MACMILITGILCFSGPVPSREGGVPQVPHQLQECAPQDHNAGHCTTPPPGECVQTLGTFWPCVALLWWRGQTKPPCRVGLGIYPFGIFWKNPLVFPKNPGGFFFFSKNPVFFQPCHYESEEEVMSLSGPRWDREESRPSVRVSGKELGNEEVEVNMQMRLVGE